MSTLRTRHFLAIALFTGMLAIFSWNARAADEFHWDATEGRVDASIKDWSLEQLLARITLETGWQVYVEPGAKQNVTVKFRNLKISEALDRMFGKLSFAIIPQTNQPAKLFVFHSSLNSATRLIRASEVTKVAGKDVKVKPNQLVVMLKPGTKIENIARQLGAKVVGRLDSLNAYLLEFPDQDATSRAMSWLSSNGDVASVDYNYQIGRPDRPVSLGAGSNPFTISPEIRADGKTTIALIDTAIQKMDPQYTQFLQEALSIAGEYTPAGGQPLHGTLMFEDIVNAMVASGQKSLPSILAVDVYGNSATTTTFDVAVGIAEALKKGADIINMSLGSDGDSEVVRSIIAAANAQGIVFTGAAGNEPNANPTYPAAYPQVISVTAADRQGGLASYANYSASVDVIAPGQSVISYGGQNWVVTGTSSATAYVTGVAGGLAAQAGGSTAGIEKIIRTKMQYTPAPATAP